MKDVLYLNISNKLVKQITETAYLNTENTNRYRPIMRFFYHKYEQAENWLYKEDVYNALKDQIDGYTIEDCQRDLDFLVEKLSLATVQDTENASTLEKFKFKNYRYQMTDYAIEIERMTIRLEEMEVKVASLEPRIFERIKLRLEKFLKIKTMPEQEIYENWTDLMQDFTNLNQSYQDFLKKFSEPKTEELLQSKLFIQHKNSLVSYLRNFIKEYISASSEISNILKQITEEDSNYLMDSLISHQKKAPKIRPDFDFDYLKLVNTGKWNSLRKWFVACESDISEGDRLLKATNNIISKITKYASSLIELHGNMVNRKEEYKYLCHLFDSKENLEEAHTLAGTILGVQVVRHFKGNTPLNSDSIIKTLEVKPNLIKVEPMKKSLKIAQSRIPIKDKTKEKEEILKKYEEEEKRKKAVLHSLISQGHIDLTGEVTLTKEERNYVLSILTKNRNGVHQDPVFGLPYKIERKEGTCQIKSEDGTFQMDSLYITLGGDENGR